MTVPALMLEKIVLNMIEEVGNSKRYYCGSFLSDDVQFIADDQDIETQL